MANLVREHINFERGLDPKDAMGTGDILYRKERLLKQYYDIVLNSNLFDMEAFKFPSFSFKSKEILGPDSKLCSNDHHYGEHASYTFGYDDGSDAKEGFYMIFDNNGYDHEIYSSKDVIRFLGLNESYHFQRGLNPKEAMNIGNIPSKMGGKEKGYKALFNNGTWSIEKYKNLSTVGEYSLVIVNDEDNITDWTIKYDDGSVAFDNPFKLPTYIKDKVKHLYKRF